MFPFFLILGSGYATGWMRLFFTHGLGGHPIQTSGAEYRNATVRLRQGRQHLRLAGPRRAHLRAGRCAVLTHGSRTHVHLSLARTTVFMED